MEATSNSYSTLTEKELIEVIIATVPASARVNHKRKRVEGLEELHRRIKSNSIQDKNEAIRVLLDVAASQGTNKPESSLIIDSLSLFINKNEKVFQTVLNGLKGQEERLFFCFSKVVLKLDHNKKRKSIKSLVDFLMSRDVLNSIGVEEVYNCLVSLGNEGLSKEVVNEVSPYLDSSPFKICAIIFSVRICAKFADHKLLPKMLKVLQKSMKGYFDTHHKEIEQEICQFLERVRDLQSLPLLLELRKMRPTRDYPSDINKAIARVLDTHPYRVNDVLEMLYGESKNDNMINAILQCFLEMEAPKIDVRKLLSNIGINWWNRYPEVRTSLHTLFIRMGKLAKPTLLEILQKKEKYDFALGCLKEIGISNEELSKIFPKPLMLQVYNFLYSHAKSKKIPKDLNQLWKDKTKLQENVPGNTDWLEHLLLHIFTGFNFVTLNVAPLKVECVDLVCLYPETLDLFIVGCTTGILKDDLAKMDALINKMEMEMPKLFDKCSITPIIVCSEVASISPSDEQYSVQQGIVIMHRQNIDILLEMLNTNRKSREVIDYIERCKLSREGLPSRWGQL